jgi:hypothetical protein
MSRLGVAVLAMDLPLPARCALIRNIWVALNEALSPIVLVIGRYQSYGGRTAYPASVVRNSATRYVGY